MLIFSPQDRVELGLLLLSRMLLDKDTIWHSVSTIRLDRSGLSDSVVCSCNPFHSATLHYTTPHHTTGEGENYGEQLFNGSKVSMVHADEFY